MSNDFFNQNNNGSDVIDINFKKYKKQIKRTVTLVVILFLLVTLGINSFYILDNREAAVVLRFGKVYNVETVAGLHFKIPFADSVRRVLDKQVFKMEYGFRTAATGTAFANPQYRDEEDEAHVIIDAADDNASITLWSLIIQYKISDPVDYLFKVEDVEGTLRLALEDSIRKTVQTFTLEDARTNKEIIDARILPTLQAKLNKYRAGLRIVSVKTQNVELLPAVEEAYRQKENANQYMRGKIEEAEKYENIIVAQTTAEVEKLIQNAKGYAAEVVANAKAAVAQFNALHAEYLNYPDIVKEKYYIEAMGQFITNNNIIIDLTSGSDIFKFYNMDDNNFVKEQISSGNR